jgi:hypothetical protein
MAESNTHVCRGTIKDKTTKAIPSGTTFIVVTLTIDDKTELDIEFWHGKMNAIDELELCPIGSKVEVHSWASTRAWVSKAGYVNRTTKLQARSITDLGAPITKETLPLDRLTAEEEGEDIPF